MRKAIIVLCLLAGAASAHAEANPVAAGDMPRCDSLGAGKPVMQTRFSLEDSYPPLSVMLGEEGYTVLGFTIQSNGTVLHAKLLRSSGSLRLDDAAVKAASQLIYSPPKLDGNPAACTHMLGIDWKLTGTQSAYTVQMARLFPPQSLYPPKAMAVHLEGATVVGVVLSSSGGVLETRMLKSSGSQELDDASTAYAATLSYKPVEVGGKPVASNLSVVVIWTLPSSKAKKAD